MRRIVAAMTFVLAFSLFSSVALSGGECCEKIKKDGQGWCDKCKHGEIYGFEVAVKRVYDVLAGTSAKDSGMEKCPGCVKAMKDSGTCSGCKVSFANGKMYTSAYAHDIAVGTSIKDAKVAEAIGKCEACKKAAASPDGGFCEKCGGGIVGGRYYASKASYDGAVNARKVVGKAVATSKQCEFCGAAIATDGTCDHCKTTYKNGEKAKG